MVCPVCKNPFRRPIQKWMVFSCKDCNIDLCSEDDITLYNGMCTKCFNKKHKPDTKKIVKEHIPIMPEMPKKEELKKLKNLDSWF